MKDPIPTIKREGFHFDLSNMKKRLLLRNRLLCSFNLLYLMKSVYIFYRCQGSFFYVHLGSEGLKHWIAGPTVIDYRILIEVPFHKDV